MVVVVRAVFAVAALGGDDDDDGTAGAPADAGRMTVDAGMLQPNFVRHHWRRDVQSARL